MKGHRNAVPISLRETAPSPPTERSRVRRTPEVSKQEIVDVARAHLSKHGFRDFTVDRLMAGTQIGRSAFYAYFSGTYELCAVFIHELSRRIEAVSTDWLDEKGDPIEAVRSSLRSAVDFWEANGRMIRALEEASWQDEALRAVFRDEIGMRVVRRITEGILRGQANGSIGPMDAREMSVALNRFNMTYLNDRFGNPRRKPKATDRQTVIETLERVWIATLYGKVPDPRTVGAAKPGRGADAKPSRTRTRTKASV